jgi:hypothetical protein
MKKILIIILLVGFFAPINTLEATIVTNVIADEIYSVGSRSIIVKAGSAYEALSIGTDSITITVPAAEVAEVRTPGIYPAIMENDGGLPTCNVLTTRDNQLLINGPKTVTIRPTALHCDVTGYGTDDTAMLSLSSPASGAQLISGASTQIFWSSSGRAPASIRLRLSLDGGASYDQTMVSSVINNGFYQWIVPEVTTTSNARIKIEGSDAGLVTAVSLGDIFTIQGVEQRAPMEEEEAEAATINQYNPLVETAAAASISLDKRLTTASFPSGSLICLANSRIKSRFNSGVYYCGVDGRRYVFPNQKTHDTWYGDFAGVIELSDAEIAAISLGGNVTYRPGVRMVKIQTDPKVYAVAAGGVLRWVRTEAAAERLYGANWNQMIDDVPDAFFVNYTVGEAIE